MPSASDTHFADLLEIALVLVGAALLWRHAFSPAARAHPAPTRLAAWDIPLAELVLFLWLVFVGGIALPLIVQLCTRGLQLDDSAKVLVAQIGFQPGMLLGVGVYHRFFAKRQVNTAPLPPFGPGATLAAGAATFLMVLPVIFVVSLLWLEVMKLIGLPPESQNNVLLFKNTKSPVILALMILFAVVIAPINEELIFRAGIFRFARTRLPRWAALLLPACLFSALHGSFTHFAPLVALGIVFSLAYERTGRIGTSMVAHGLFNLYSVVRIFLDPAAS